MKPWKCFWGAMLLCLLLLASCGEPNEVRTALNTADSLLADGQPDSAYSLLSSLPQPIMAKMPTKSLMRYELLKARAQNSAYIPFTSDSTMLRVADYYDRHGNANEQMTANYVLGCAYYDMGEAPLALRYFHEACDRADTTAADCDWKTLSRVHGQMATILMDQLSPYDALEEMEIALSCAKTARDTMMYLAVWSNKRNVYEELECPDSVVSILEKVAAEYARLGKRNLAAITRCPMVYPLIKKCDIPRASRILSDYEKYSGLFDNEGNIQQGYEAYYYLKGLLYMLNGKTDSAENSYRKLLSVSETANHHEMGCRGLFDLFKQTGKMDSVMKYAQLFCDYNDSTYLEKTTETFQQMQAMHKYTRQEQLAEKRKKELEKKNKWLLIAGFSISLLLLAGVIVFLHERRHRDRIVRMAEEQWNRIETLQQKKSELEYLLSQANRQNDSKIIDERIRKLEKEIESFAKDKKRKKISQSKSKIMEDCFIERCLKNPTALNDVEKSDLCTLINMHAPELIPFLYQQCPCLAEDELYVCLFTWIGIRTKQMGCLLGIDSHDASMKQKRLMEKVFHTKGGAKDFKQAILSL